MHETVISLGPSLAAADISIVSDVDVVAPIRRGDLPKWIREGTRRVGIVDGEFSQALAVSIAEIRDALGAGIEVWGASSMGALRAVECSIIGMRGVGWIYSAFAEGRLEADEEVAVMFDPISEKALTVPLVNIRWAVERAVCEGVIRKQDGRDLVAIAASMGFRDRSYESIIASAELSSLRHSAEDLCAFAQTRPLECDRKRLDALELFSAMDILR